MSILLSISVFGFLVSVCVGEPYIPRSTIVFPCAGDEYLSASTRTCRKILACGLLRVDYNAYNSGVRVTPTECLCVDAIGSVPSLFCGAECVTQGVSQSNVDAAPCRMAPLGALGFSSPSLPCSPLASWGSKGQWSQQCSAAKNDFMCAIATAGLSPILPFSSVSGVATGVCGLTAMQFDTYYTAPRAVFAGVLSSRNTPPTITATWIVGTCGPLVDPRATLSSAPSQCICMANAVATASSACGGCIDGYNRAQLEHPDGSLSPYSLCAQESAACPVGSFSAFALAGTPCLTPVSCGQLDWEASKAAGKCVCKPGYGGGDTCFGCSNAAGGYNLDGECFDPRDATSWSSRRLSVLSSRNNHRHRPNTVLSTISSLSASRYARDGLFYNGTGTLPSSGAFNAASWLLCGQAYDLPSSPPGITHLPIAVSSPGGLRGFPIQCVCLPNAQYSTTDPSGCVCTSGFVFNNKTASCAPHSSVCGPVRHLDTSITSACVCRTPGTYFDYELRACVCPGANYYNSEMGACRPITELCTAGVDLDIAATRVSGVCTCIPGRGDYYNELGKRFGCDGCSSFLGVVEPNITGLASTGSLYAAWRMPSTPGGQTCVPVPTVCGEYAHLNLKETLRRQVCVCAAGYTGAGCNACDTTIAFELTPKVCKRFSECGTGVVISTTANTKKCRCDTSRGFMDQYSGSSTCSACSTAFFSPSMNGASCRETTIGRCGVGVDSVATTGWTCVCAKEWLPFAQQPNGRCTLCAPGYSPVNALCVKKESITPAPVPKYALESGEEVETKRLDTIMAHVVKMVAHDARWSCRSTWKTLSEQSLVSSKECVAAPFYTASKGGIVTSAIAARVACSEYYKCTGFLLYDYDASVGWMRPVYLTWSGGDCVLETFSPPKTVNGSVAVFKGKHLLDRAFGVQCPVREGGGDALDYEWYLRSWYPRIAAAGYPIPNIALPAGVQWSDADAPFLGAKAIVEHWLRIGKDWLEPNAGCRRGPPPADALTGCRSPTCRTASICPLGTLWSDAHDWCVAIGSAESAFGATNIAALGHMTPPCAAGECVWGGFNKLSEAHCVCPRTGVALAGVDPACDTDTFVDGVSPCTFKDPRPECVALRRGGGGGGEGGKGCAPGFYGPLCGYFDYSGVCGEGAGCGGHGTCTPGTGGGDAYCRCEKGFYGATCASKTCETDCGPYGECAGNGTMCLCAVDAESDAPLAATGGKQGLCIVDLCRTGDRTGTLKLLSMSSLNGAPLGECVCDALPNGATNGGPFCNTPLCPNNCGLATHSPQVCIPCTLEPSACTSYVGAPLLGGFCDCDEIIRGTKLYTLPGHTRYTTSGVSSGKCDLFCPPPSVWSSNTNDCVCTDPQYSDNKCTVRRCANGVAVVDTGVCGSCDRRWALDTTKTPATCSKCAPGYSGQGCATCATGYGMDRDGSTCTKCGILNGCAPESTDMGAALCALPAQGAPGTCPCYSGYMGVTCELCAPGYFRDISSSSSSGVCTSCTELGKLQRTVAPVCPGESVRGGPQGSRSGSIRCIPGFSRESDCKTCEVGYIPTGGTPTAPTVCTSCTEYLRCSPDNTLSVICSPDSTRGLCVCNSAAGFGGTRCDTCDTSLGWAPIPNTSPLRCRKCNGFCGPNGDTVCGELVDTCACSGGWTGATCGECPYCGLTGKCTPRGTPEWCRCEPGYRRPVNGPITAPCTECATGYVRAKGSVFCVKPELLCGSVGVDVPATLAAGACVCGSGRLPWAEQPHQDCTTCSPGLFGASCTTCSPACGPREICSPAGCVCREGYTGSTCGTCAPGFTGFPTCVPCPSMCTLSGGTCTFLPVPAPRTTCTCPAGSKRVDEAGGRCVPCAPGESKKSCLPCPTCPRGSSCGEVNGGVTCVCDAGKTRPQGAAPLLVPCDTPQVVASCRTPVKYTLQEAIADKGVLFGLLAQGGGVVLVCLCVFVSAFIEAALNKRGKGCCGRCLGRHS